MDCKPQVSKDTFKEMRQESKLDTLYDMQAITMECITVIDQKLEKRKLLDRISVAVGGVVGGVLGAIGFKQIG